MSSNPILDSIQDISSILDDPVYVPPAQLGNIKNSGLSTSIEERALALLGSGINGEAVAAALGVTPSRISQLLSDEGFSARVATARYEALQKHNVRDNVYDKIEDKLLTKLEGSLSLMIRPDAILRALSIINGAKRRGQAAPEQIHNIQNIVTLVLPTKVVQQFAVNLNNQVIRAGEQELVTIPSGALRDKLEQHKEQRRSRSISHVPDAENP